MAIPGALRTVPVTPPPLPVHAATTPTLPPPSVATVGEARSPRTPGTMLWLVTAAVLLLVALIVGLLLSGWGSKDRGKVEPKPPAGIKEQPKPAPPAPLGKNDTNSIGMKFVRVPGGTFWQGGGGGTEGTA